MDLTLLEVGAAGTIYEHTHAGWVGITTYTDTHGNTRTKTEVFVAWIFDYY